MVADRMAAEAIAEVYLKLLVKDAVRTWTAFSYAEGRRTRFHRRNRLSRGIPN
jgi:hypothetical protein